MLERWKKYFSIKALKPLDRIVSDQRSVKSDYELFSHRKLRQLHRQMTDEIIRPCSGGNERSGAAP